MTVITRSARKSKMSVHTQLQPPRRSERKRVLMAATLVTCSGSKRVRIRDFSAKGAQVVAEGDICNNCDVLLKRGDLCTAARVAWVRGDEVGLTFYREVSTRDLAG